MKLRKLIEKVDPAKIDANLYPNRLSKVNQKLASTVVNNSSPGDEDLGDTKKAGLSADQLKISQTTMDLDKFIGMGIGMMCRSKYFPNGPGGDLGAIVSSDNHIMDGHHRWAATILANPKAKVFGLFVSLPGEKLVGVLNTWTAARKQKGKPSTHKMAQLSPDAIKARFIELASKGGGALPDAQTILQGLQQNNYGSVEQAAETAAKNWAANAKLRAIESWMPEKIDMPAIEQKQLAQVASDIQQGKIDLNPPYSEPTKKAAQAAGVDISEKTMKASEFKKLIREEVHRALKQKSIAENKTVRELKFTSAGVKELLKTVFNNLHLLPKLGFDTFKQVLDYIKFGDQEEQTELENRLKSLGVNLVSELKQPKKSEVKKSIK